MTTRPAVRAVGAFCPHCGASIKKMTPAELALLGTLRTIENEYRETMKDRGRALATFPPSAGHKVIALRSGLHEDTVYALLVRLCSLGYTESRKAYGRRHYLYRLSDAAYGDPYLNGLIDAARERKDLP